MLNVKSPGARTTMNRPCVECVIYILKALNIFEWCAAFSVLQCLSFPKTDRFCSLRESGPMGRRDSKLKYKTGCSALIVLCSENRTNQTLMEARENFYTFLWSSCFMKVALGLLGGKKYIYIFFARLYSDLFSLVWYAFVACMYKCK